MADDSGDITSRPPDPFIRARVERPGVAPPPGVSVAGLFGDSDREGHRRLYLTTRLDYYVEFAVSDVLAVESIPADSPPFPGLDATRVTLARDAVVNWTRSRPFSAADAFAVDAVVRDERMQPQFTETWQARCPGVTEHFGQSAFRPCEPGGGGTGHGGGTGPTTTGPWPVVTRDVGATCQCTGGTCDTCAGPSCVTCAGGRCETVATCGTCGGWTCDRGCTGDCGQPAQTWGGSCAATCEGTCVSCNVTCEASCAGTCAGATCEGTCGRDTCHTCVATCQATCESCNTCIGCFTERWTNCMASCECRF